MTLKAQLAGVGSPPMAAALVDDHPRGNDAMTSCNDNTEVLDVLDLQNDIGDAVYNLSLAGMVQGPDAAARIADDLCGQVEEAVRLMGKVPASRAKLAKVLVDHVKVLSAMANRWAADE